MTLGSIEVGMVDEHVLRPVALGNVMCRSTCEEAPVNKQWWGGMIRLCASRTAYYLKSVPDV
jgi:hypothetical protein